jgi:hypothetical protein
MRNVVSMFVAIVSLSLPLVGCAVGSDGTQDPSESGDDAAEVTTPSAKETNQCLPNGYGTTGGEKCCSHRAHYLGSILVCY